MHAAARRAIEIGGAHAADRNAARVPPARTTSATRPLARSATRGSRHAAGAQRFEHRIDAVDQHHEVARCRPIVVTSCTGYAWYHCHANRRSKRRRALAAAEDLREAGARRQFGAAIDRRHRQIELRALRRGRSARSGSDETAPSPSARSCAFTSFATARNRSRSSRGARRQLLGQRARRRARRHRRASRRGRARSASAASGVVVEQERQPRRHLIEPIDRRRRHRHHRREELEPARVRRHRARPRSLKKRHRQLGEPLGRAIFR